MYWRAREFDWKAESTISRMHLSTPSSLLLVVDGEMLKITFLKIPLSHVVEHFY
jgi:hypothetical protein